MAAAKRVLNWLEKKPCLAQRIRSGTRSTPPSGLSRGVRDLHSSLPGKSLAEEGAAHEDSAAGEDQKCAVFGAVDYASGQVIFHLSTQKGEDAFMAFLDHLAHTLPADDPVVFVLDNAGNHKSHALREQWRRYTDRLQPFFLPAYAPELNLIERLWRYLKDKLACHRWWNDLARL